MPNNVRVPQSASCIIPDSPELTQQLMQVLAHFETHFGAKAIIQDTMWAIKLHARLAPNLHMMHPNETIGGIYVFASARPVSRIKGFTLQPRVACLLGIRKDLCRTLPPAFKDHLFEVIDSSGGGAPAAIKYLAHAFLAIAAPRTKCHRAANRYYG